MKKQTLSVLLGLYVVALCLPAKPVRAELMNPREVVVKAISPTPAQVKKLDAFKETLDKNMNGAIEGIGERYIKSVLALSETPKYKAQLEAASALAEAEREPAIQKVWEAMNTEVRPGLEKELFTLMRGLAVTYFDSVQKLATAAQKPKLAKARTTVLANFDKELPALLQQLTAELKVDKKD